MSELAGEAAVMGIFNALTGRDRTMIETFAKDPDSALEEAEQTLRAMLPDIAYIEEPDHPMASSMYFCAFMLAIYLPLRERGASVHDFGGLMLRTLEQQPKQPVPETAPRRMAEAAALSQTSAKDGEFIFDVYDAEGDDVDWGMNVKSCAICSFFSRYDAMDLVPYMCASDDVTSDVSGQGLRRTGTIALGASQCDFKFRKDGEGHHLSGQYPERIKILD